MEKLLEKFMSKKAVENLVTFLVLAVILVVVLNSIYSDKDKKNVTSGNTVIATSNTKNYKTDFEIRLENVLSKIKGVGKADVMVSYENDVQKIPMVDTKNVTTVTSEKDSAGGERKTEETNSETTIIYESNGSSKTPVVKEYTVPIVKGVIVVAEGGDAVAVKEKIISAVESITGVSSHKIQVYGK